MASAYVYSMPDESVDEATNTFTISRRAVVGAALAALAAVSPASARAGKNPKKLLADGFFISYKDPNASRLFFLKSEWLSYFDVTDLYTQTDLDNVVGKVQNKARNDNRSQRWSVLYTDVLDSNKDVVEASLAVATTFPAPPPNSTYLAMSISPGIT